MWIPELVDRDGIPLQMGVVKSVLKVVLMESTSPLAYFYNPS
jgi:hypothetical protein